MGDRAELERHRSAWPWLDPITAQDSKAKAHLGDLVHQAARLRSPSTYVTLIPGFLDDVHEAGFAIVGDGLAAPRTPITTMMMNS